MAETYCHQPTEVEQVVTTTYSLVCPIHGHIAGNLSLREAHEMPFCPMPHEERGAAPNRNGD